MRQKKKNGKNIAGTKIMKNITIKRTEKDEQFEEDITQLADERQKKTESSDNIRGYRAWRRKICKVRSN